MNSAAISLRSTARRIAHRIDNPEVRAARLLLRRLRRDPPDVIYFGESAVVHTAPYDIDRRNLGRMVADALGQRASVQVIAGAGYSAELFLAYLRLLASYEVRPLVLHPLWIRGRFTPWMEHPIYGHKLATATINRIDPHGPLRQAFAGYSRPAQQAFDRHGQLPIETLLGLGQIQDYTVPLREKGKIGARKRTRLLYAYHHGQRLMSDSPALASTTRLGATLAELGVPTLAYHTPVCVQTGVEVLGPEFETLVRCNAEVLEAAYLAGHQERPPVLQTGAVFGPHEFVDPAYADEHLNDRGRSRLAAMIVEAIRVAGASPQGVREKTRR